MRAEALCKVSVSSSLPALISAVLAMAAGRAARALLLTAAAATAAVAAEAAAVSKAEPAVDTPVSPLSQGKFTEQLWFFCVADIQT